MTNNQAHNTKTRKREDFIPSMIKTCGCIFCGPTVYEPRPLGQRAPPHVFDVLTRLLRQSLARIT